MPAITTLQNYAYGTIITIGLGWLTYIGSSIILPVLFAALLAIFLTPLDQRLIKYVKYKWLSILLSFIVIIIPLSLVVGIFSVQLLNIMESLPSIGENLKIGINQGLRNIRDFLPFLKINSDQLLSDTINSALEGPLKIIGSGLISSTQFLLSSVLMIIYAFFMLYYRNSFRNFIIFRFEKSMRPDIRSALTKIKQTIQAYVAGLGSVIIILSILNSIGLWAIGIEYPIFWGTLAGCLAIIPFVGTGLGGLLPFLYALATADHSWQPIAVVIYYAIIQQIEGNIITPKIVGDKVNINPLAALLTVVIFGTLWGIGGVVLALPIISIIRIILSQFDNTVPYAILLGSEVADDADKFKKLASKKK